MSVATMVKNESMALIENVQSFFRLSFHYLKKNNPALIAYAELNMAVKNVLTANKKIKVARYRVNHLRYRLYQMEKLINDNNPNNYLNGSHFNQLR